MAPSLLYFAPVPFSSYAQRPHFMVRALRRSGVARVVWVEPYPTRLPRWGDLSRREGSTSAITDESGVDVIGVRSVPIEPIPGGGAVNSLFLWRGLHARLRALTGSGDWIIGVGRPSVLAVWALEELQHKLGFYDAMDDFPAFYSGLSAFSMARRERQVVDRTQARFCSSHRLVEKLRDIGCDAELVLNGYDMSLLPSPLPETDRRYVGYVGTIGQWFDWPLVAEMAAALPHRPFRLVGPEFVSRPRVLPPNIEILPACPQPEAIEHVRRFAIGLIPFVRSRLTESVDPIKYYEYRALGVPVVSTNFGEMANRSEADGVVKVDRGAKWELMFEHARQLEIRDDGLANFRIGADWNSRFEPLVRRIIQQ